MSKKERPYLYEDSKGNVKVDHITLARFILQMNKIIRFRNVHTLEDNYYLFDHEFGWKQIKEDDIMELMSYELDTYHKRHIVNESFAFFRSQVEVYKDTKFMNLPRFLYPIKNGLIDISDPEDIIGYAFEEGMYHDYTLNVEYTASTYENNLFLDFIDFTLGYDALPFKQAAGLAFLRENPIPEVVILFGYGGDGKSTILNSITHILGTKSLSRPLEEITGKSANQFTNSWFLNKQANVFADDRTDKINKIERLKGLSGNDPFDVELKGKGLIKVKMSIKFFLGMNDKPWIAEINEATKRRMYIFPMKQTMEAVTAWIKENIGEAYHDGFFEQFYEGFFIECITEAVKLIKSNARRLTLTPESQKYIDDWFAENDLIQQFLDEHTRECAPDVAYHTLKDFTEYFVNEYGVNISRNKMKAELEKRGVIIGRKRLTLPGGVVEKNPDRNAISGRQLITVFDVVEVDNKSTILPFRK